MLTMSRRNGWEKLDHAQALSIHLMKSGGSDIGGRLSVYD